MSIRERMTNAYLGKQNESIPVGIYSRYLPRGDSERLIRNSGLGIIKYYPMVSLLSPPWHILPGFLSEVKGADFSVRTRWEKGEELQEMSYTTPVGSISQIIKRDSQAAGSEQIVKHYITELEDYKVMQYLIENTVFKSNLEDFERLEKTLGEDGVVLCRLDRSGYQKLMIELVGPERFFLDYFDYPELIEELINTIDRRGDEQLDLVLATGRKLIWQPDNVSGDMTPPDTFEKLHLPVYRDRQSKIEKAGGRYILHIDGKISGLLPSLEQLGSCIIESFSLPCIGGDLEMGEVKEKLGDHRIFPNFPSNWTRMSEQELRQNLVTLKGELEDLDYPTMLQVSEDIPEYSYKFALPIIMDVFKK